MRLALALVLAISAGCGHARRIDVETKSLDRRLDDLETDQGLRCAPVLLARGRAELEFVSLELAQGNLLRATQHRNAAVAAVDGADATIAACPPPDADRDGVADPEDACVDVPGLSAYAGCPDSDGDGVPDPKDACVDVPEDLDGFEDEDGCPEEEDRDEDGVLGAADACPDVPGPADNQGCPYGDRDGDGLKDPVDRCPDQPEDVDQFEDADGCPDADNDGDGIPDVDDLCPLDPETVNGHRDDDGCPDEKLTLVELDRDEGKIEIKQKVFFARGRARLSRRSFGLLGQVSQVLRENPELNVVIEGHTDATGSNSTNLRLSQARADAVRRYMIQLGVDAGRLKAIGYGEEQPIAPNGTPAGRERNRRVEFTIAEE